MTINLPLGSAKWPIFRVLVANKWNTGASSATSDAPWQILPMLSSTKRPDNSGMRVLSYSRCLLPQTGTARLAFSYGRFLGRIIGTTLMAGGTWDPAVDSVSAPDLTGKEVRIQAALPPDDPAETPAWVTVFWGTCEYQLDEGQGAADVPAGERIYHLVDGLERLKRWPVNSHGWDNGASYRCANVYGNPGYNYSERGTSNVLGNKASTSGFTTRCGATASYHCRQGTGQKWTDQEAVENMLANSTPRGEPLFTMSGSVTQYSDSTAIEIQEGASAFDVLTKSCSRGRGNGALGLYFVDAGNALTVALKAFPQLAYGLTYPVPSTGSTATIPGAATEGTLVTVDVIGDHRFVDNSLLLGDPQQYECEYNETLGEKIQVLASIGFPDTTLQEGWTANEATAFRALAATDRRDPRWGNVYQAYRIHLDSDFSFGDGLNTDSKARCDFSCNDSGQIGTAVATSPGLVTIMDDLPLYEGYKYDSLPTRNDGTGIELTTPPRRPPFFYFKSDTGILPGQQVFESLSFKIHEQYISVEKSDDQAYGSRFISDPAYSGNLGTVYDYNMLAMTLGLEMPNRVRLASGTPGSRRIRVNYVPNLHLWIASQSAVYGFTPAVNSIYPPLTNCCPETSGIIRDDRDDLAKLHWLSVAWYGPASALGLQNQLKRNSSWALRCCGDIPSSVDYDGGGVVYPKIGECVQAIYANGQYNLILTPVSSIVYDNESGVTTWTTDWQDLDFK